MSPNRIAALLTALAGAAGAVAVPVANINPLKPVPGLTLVGVAFLAWLRGWQLHEARVGAGSVPTGSDDVFGQPPAPGDVSMNADVADTMGGSDHA